MKQALIISIAMLFVSSAAAQAACTVEFKAKRDNPTQYRHEVMSVPDNKCTAAAARAHVEQQLNSRGWTLLSIVKVSG